jgi:hypothetical protein
MPRELAINMNLTADSDRGAVARALSSLEPGVIAHRLALVQALGKASREAEAGREVQAAQAVATDETDRKRLEEWGTFMSSRPK